MQTDLREEVKQATSLLVLYTVSLLRELHGEEMTLKILSPENTCEVFGILDGKLPAAHPGNQEASE